MSRYNDYSYRCGECGTPVTDYEAERSQQLPYQHDILCGECAPKCEECGETFAEVKIDRAEGGPNFFCGPVCGLRKLFSLVDDLHEEC